MPPGKNAETASNKASSAKTRQPAQIRTTTTLEADSSRLISTSDAMSTSTEPAIAAMVDVSSWAQRGLVLENKEIRRSLEMLKSGHAAQLAQISKRHKTDKEELEIKLQAETYRQVAQQRTVEQLSGQVKHLQEEKEKLVGNMEELVTELANKAEQNAILQQDYDNSKLSLAHVQDQYHHLEDQHEQLKSRDSRVTAMVNEQHDKIMRLSQAYNALEEQEKQSSEAAKIAEKEVDRLKSRLSSILSTLAKVVGENQDEQGLDTGSGSEKRGGMEVATLEENSEVEAGRKADYDASVPATESRHHLTGNEVGERHAPQEIRTSATTQDEASRLSRRHTSTLRYPQQVTPTQTSQTTSVTGRAKRRRIVSDPDSGPLGKAPEIQVKRERELPGPNNARNDVYQPLLADKALQQGIGMEIEILIPMTAGTASATNLMEGGEDSPERAAVESAIGAQEEEGQVPGIAEDEINETSGSKKRPRKTYGQKRNAEEMHRTTVARDDTPAPDTSSTSAVGHAIEGPLLATPQSGRLAVTASDSHTPSHATRARTGKPTKGEVQSHLARPDHSSPLLSSRQYGKGNMIPGEKSSPAMVKVKEEVHDSADDGRPRIVGGDDEDDPLCI
ncbi:hypothetical protein QFC22_003567 [Naganishia vaughanmartiniae]|uniref:Uncharacterized protein n=1 Tax=Naganishia vaughanmartiniae TaxID=1424756 RepID=A0ACC2X601_9TREE|nr:hypothetical protein QFC22_003567 [Naganishia vaughanmartiniae]